MRTSSNGSLPKTPLVPFRWLLAASIAITVALTDWSGLSLRSDELVRALPHGLLLTGVLAAAALAVHAVTIGGASAGVVVGTILLVLGGWPAWLLLATSFAVTVAATRLGRERKSSRGIAEARGGRRAAANVLANTAVGALASLVAASQVDDRTMVIAAAAALAVGASDSVASEIGKAVGGRTWLLPWFRPVAAGTTGAVSIAGTLAGIGAALAFGSVVRLTGLSDLGGSAVLTAAVVAAFILEGVAARLLEDPGVIDNDGVNLLACAAGAALAWELYA